MKILVEPIDINHLYELNKKDIHGFIIGIKNYSIFQNLKLSIEELKEIKTDKELYISLNKPIHNNELENLIWASMHLPTNYRSCNFWNKKGCTGALLSTELMISDFIDIKKNTNMNIFVYLYGYIPIFESSRTLITNYLKHINKSNDSKVFYAYEKERDKYYLIYEEYDNTFITEDILNGINVVNELKENDIDYIILNSLMHKEEDFEKIVDEYIEAVNGKYFNKKDVFTGFLFKESIFKVK